jgi:23S rRNA (guanosine2251-2'-O)-methyltransferase
MSLKKSSKPSIYYGIHAVNAALKNMPNNQACLYYSDQINPRIEAVCQLAQKMHIPTTASNKNSLESLCKASQHQGVVLISQGTVTKKTHPTLDQLLKAKKDTLLLLILEQVQDPHNLGACLRTALAANVDAVLLTKHNSCGITETVSHVACGAVEHLNIITITNLATTLRQLKKHQLWIYGTSEHATETLHHSSFQNQSTALIMGQEGKGLRHQTQKLCDFLISIPTSINMPSLNVSVATGVILFEIVRQKAILTTN